MEKSKKIMIVEDERIVALSIKEILTSEGYRVCGIAGSADHLFREIPAKQPDLVIMDVKIKGCMDGIEAAKILKTRYSIPVVYLTAFSDKTLLDRAKQTEPMGYLLKPFKPNELISVAKVALHKAENERGREQRSLELEMAVRQRTQKLNDEIAFRKQVEKQLREKTEHLKEANKALKNLLEIRDAEKRAREEGMLMNLKMIVAPYLELIENQTSDPAVHKTLQLMEEALKKSCSSTSQTLFAKYLELTPQEVKISELIRHGKRTKDIATLLNIAPSSVSTHRYSIRKKLGLLNTSTSLSRYLNSVEAE